MQILPDTLFDKIGFNAIRTRLADFALAEQTKEWLAELKPARAFNQVQSMLDGLHEMTQLLDAGEDLPIAELPDIRKALKQARIEGNLLPTYQFNNLLSVAISARTCAQFIARNEEKLPNLLLISSVLEPLKELEKAITQVISKEGEVRSDASSALVKIRRALNQKRSELRSIVQRVMRKAQNDGMAEDSGSGITIRDGRMVIPVKAEYKRQIAGFIHDSSATGQTVYLEPVEALHVNNDIRELEQEERKEIERILRELTAKVRVYVPAMSLNFDTLCELDVVRAKALFAKLIKAEVCFPTKSRKISLFNAFNPHLVLSNQKKAEKNREQIIPLDLVLEENERCLVITGPNAGGKSVAMKTLGLMACMLQSGLAIPAREDSKLPLFDGFFVDLGDNQSVENDLSTFSSRLKWMKGCIELATKNSLILVDEAGAGTDPDEGSALYQSLAESMLKLGAHIVITTHHGTLKVFAENHELALNGSMEFSQERLEPTYKFRKGVPGSSYGFEIARRMRINEHLVKRARDLVGSGKSKVEHLIISLEQKEQQAHQLTVDLTKQTTKLNKQLSDYETKLKSLQKKSDSIKEKALVEAKRIVDQANKRVEQAVEEALRVAKSKEEAIKARKGIDKLKSKIGNQLSELDNKKIQERIDGGDQPKVGDRVKLADSLTFGELVEINGKKAVVMTNGLRLKTNYVNLEKVAQPQKSGPQPRTKGYTLTVADADPDAAMVSLRLDLRGKRGDAAIHELQQYIDRVLLANLKQVEIVHGKGNGVLKQLVHEYLAAEKAVFHYELAPEDQGGSGCTVVAMR